MGVKRQVYKRAKGKCEKCGRSLTMREGDFHHVRDPTVTPRAKSVRFLCPLCHRRYGHKRVTRKVETFFGMHACTSRTDPPRGSLGEWLMSNITKTAIASYVGAILTHEGYAEKRGSYIKFR